MNFVKNLKDKFVNNLLKQKLKRNPRQKDFHNIKSAKNIGIIFESDSQQTYQTIKKLIAELKPREISCIGWVDSEELPDYTIGQKTIFINHNDCKWTGEGKTHEIDNFINKKFDLLFVLTESDAAPIKYITTLSQAACKVGYYNSKKNNPLDFMISHKTKHSIENLIKDSLDFLSTIKKN